MENKEIIRLINELMYQRHLFNREYSKDGVMKMKVAEYIALEYIAVEEETGLYAGRAYLKDLADKLQMSMRQVSQMAGKLRDAGYVLWSHDGDGSEGTYVTITESGRNIIKTQEENLKEYYGHVIDKFGKENLMQLLQLMKQLETVMSSESENMEG
ncbi:MAG: MarR family winged helix-turn-helix transcriptional regulator [Clostridia bacterium]|nr:MarR family winged helix-turn-helix transcriptional regulator [Clostridia bacterium]MDO5303429.1 MarR family winged helix-turn-helix transcriptional regulator [Clostridia bacterium]